MKGFAFGLILVLCGVAEAADPSRYPLPDEADSAALQTALKSNHFNVHSIGSVNGQKYIFWGKNGETKNPDSLIEAAMSPADRTMRQLAKKWAAGTITPEEKDALLKAFVLRSLKVTP